MPNDELKALINLLPDAAVFSWNVDKLVFSGFDLKQLVAEITRDRGQMFERIESLTTRGGCIIFRGRHDWCIDDLNSETEHVPLIKGYYDDPIEALEYIKPVEVEPETKL